MSLDDLHPLFLGAYAENADLLEDLLVDFLRDHVYWRRNFHPEDRPPIPTSAQYRDDYVDFIATMKQELYSLSADLKQSVPWFSPRYVGHMASDLLLPGLIARLITTLYNPNNVAEEAAPATLDKEIEVGFQLAEMFGFPTDEDERPCAWGHLTSGGTIANYEGLRNIRALRHYPLALEAAAERTGLKPGAIGPLDAPLTEHSDWELFQLSIAEIVELREVCLARLRKRSRQDFQEFTEAVADERLESRGAVDFYRAHPELETPIVLAPTTAHYCWDKAMKVLGLGTDQLVYVDVDANMRMEMEHLREIVDTCADEHQPILATIGVLGSTEFGTVDPIGDLMEMRREYADRGCYFSVHIDAAWGGYLASVFRDPDGELIDRRRLQKEFHYFPSRTVYDAFAALEEADSITVDPHKLGYVPYPAGAYVARHAGMIDFITQEAAYVFDVENESADLRDDLHKLGQYILEGSKPGSAAASAHVTHETLPLHTEGFGRILKETVRACEYFFDRIDEVAERLADDVVVTIPFEPDSNLVCLAINPVDNDSLAQMNAFTREIFDALRVDTSIPIQDRAFIASYTSIFPSELTDVRIESLLDELGLDPDTLREVPDDPELESDHVFMIRNTLMNPWLRYEDEGRNYIDRYLDFLEETIRERLADWR